MAENPFSLRQGVPASGDWGASRRVPSVPTESQANRAEADHRFAKALAEEREDLSVAPWELLPPEPSEPPRAGDNDLRLKKMKRSAADTEPKTMSSAELAEAGIGSAEPGIEIETPASSRIRKTPSRLSEPPEVLASISVRGTVKSSEDTAPSTARPRRKAA